MNERNYVDLCRKFAKEGTGFCVLLLLPGAFMEILLACMKHQRTQ